ncbi:MAG TPA: cytochrome P450 [Gemmatimonadaceae bacterium]
MLSRYADVVAALGDSRLSGGGDAGPRGTHVAMREAARRAFSADRLAAWKQEIESSARACATSLSGSEFDLVGNFAAPWGLSVAMLATAAPSSQAEQLAMLARKVFLSAAHATDAEVSPAGQEASAELARIFATHAEAAPIHVQAFVALSQTLPCFLAAAWHALLEHPDELARLRADRSLMPSAVEELLRFAGPSRAVFRRATSGVNVGGAQIDAGDRVVLLLSAANRDPDRFDDPDRLNLDRDATGHLAFGRGTHFCAGAPLIRTALTAATSVLLDTSLCNGHVAHVEWIDGYAIRGPVAILMER